MKILGFLSLQRDATEFLAPIIAFVLSTLRLTAFHQGTESSTNLESMASNIAYALPQSSPVVVQMS